VTDERDNAGVIAPPPLIYLGPLILGLLVNRKLPVPFLPRGTTRAVGWPLLVGGVSLMSWFFFTMRRADTPIDPREPVSNLATGGPFRYTRNPAYLSMAMIYAGITLPSHKRLRSAVLRPNSLPAPHQAAQRRWSSASCRSGDAVRA
jgi:protein-S-isoprenylcysteine O-methyltransferase Ste14